MVNKAVRTALERLWKDRCSIFIREEVTDPVTHLTDSEEKPLLQNQPCKLSFETLTSTNEDEVATAQQVVTLSLSPDVMFPQDVRSLSPGQMMWNEPSPIPVPVNRVFSPTIKKSCLNPSGGGPDGKMGPV